MTMHALGGRFLRGLAVLVATAAVAAPAAPDPWATVPALPTGCYSSLDDFAEKIAAAGDAISMERDRQDKVNSELTSRLSALGPAEMQTRMQTFMMSNPQEAMKLMQQNQALGDTFADDQLKAEANRQKLTAELEGLQARYKTALEAARAPIDARFKELDTRAQKDLVVSGESWVYAPWAVKEHNALVAQWNASSEKVCADWWTASGPFHGWLRRYREHLTQDVIPSREQAENLGAGFMVHLLDTPDASFRSTATLSAVREYIDQAAQVFAERERAPMPPS